MDSISVNHIQMLATTLKRNTPVENQIGPVDMAFSATDSQSSPSVEVKLSPAASQIAKDIHVTSRFSSKEEQSENKTRVVSTWITLEELENGTRRPFATPEDERLSHLTLKELMAESMKLPRVDEHGHLQSGFAGTEQGDRIGVAIANIILESQYRHKKSAEAVEASLSKFKQHISDNLGIDPESYKIVFKNGKVTVISNGGEKGADSDALKKIQDVLDNPNDVKPAKALQNNIALYNTASHKLIDNQLTQYIYGAQQNRYLPKEVSSDWLMDGVDYSKATHNSNLSQKYLAIIAGANEKYHAALEPS